MTSGTNKWLGIRNVRLGDTSPARLTVTVWKIRHSGVQKVMQRRMEGGKNVNTETSLLERETTENR